MSRAHDTEFLRCMAQGHRGCRSHDPLPWLAAAAIVWALFVLPCLWAQGSKPTDYDVKAVYLYNFGRFVEWPASVAAKSDAFTVCVLGQDPFGSALDATLASETIGGK